MRKVLYLNRLSDGATTVAVYTGEIGKGSLHEYGARSPRLVERIRRFARKHGRGSNRPDKSSEVYEIVDEAEQE
jgi:hypothetical protein